MSELDELFGEGEGAPTPRTGLILTLLVTGILTAIVGMACTAAPGGLMVLLAWMLVEKEMDRLESGYLSGESRPTVQRLRLTAYGAVLLVILLFVVQGALFCSGFYDGLWLTLLELVAAPPPAPVTP